MVSTLYLADEEYRIAKAEVKHKLELSKNKLDSVSEPTQDRFNAMEQVILCPLLYHPSYVTNTILSSPGNKILGRRNNALLSLRPSGLSSS